MISKVTRSYPCLLLFVAQSGIVLELHGRKFHPHGHTFLTNSGGECIFSNCNDLGAYALQLLVFCRFSSVLRSVGLGLHPTEKQGVQTVEGALNAQKSQRGQSVRRNDDSDGTLSLQGKSKTVKSDTPRSPMFV